MTQYTLKLTFDLRQVTQSLAYEFIADKQGEAYPIEIEGPLAGTFNFKKGDEINVKVEAMSAAHPDEPKVTPGDILESFVVNDCTFVSVRARMTQHLSLFHESNACATVADWTPIKDESTPDDKQKNLRRLTRHSTEPLTVKSKNGQWEISGYLSTELTRADGKSEAELYFFDPESSSGSGGGWGP